MSANLTLIITGASLIGVSVYLLLERSLTRVLVGLLMLGNGVNLLFMVAAGPSGHPPVAGKVSAEDMTDPLPQALVLTAIVIALGTTAFALAMAYRSWQLNGHDDVQDDVEDAAIRRRALRDEASDSYDLTTGGPDDDDSAPEEKA